jgi:tRNA-2-methylthio-N6-dimethylallyladenosine synthase
MAFLFEREKRKTLMKYWLITYGCQANFSDSERIERFLSEKHQPALSRKKADLIVINCCSVRQSAVNRVYGQIAEIEKESSAQIIVTGCLLEKDRKKISEFIPINALLKKKNYFSIKPKSASSFSALIPIMSGCDNFCTYCAVPYTRGREKSREIKEILAEVKDFASRNYKEIWLLGQNVNSYKPSFSHLLEKASQTPGDFWLRFTSSHPKDLTKDVIKAIKNSEKVTPYINLPVQSGDNTILKKMNRPYKVSDFKKCVALLRKEIPDIFLSTDVIVGFPGETEKHFQNTVKLFNEIDFNMAYISCYSPRPGTKASLLEDNVSIEEKKKRKEILNDILKRNNTKRNKKFFKKELRVLVNKANKGYLWGKTKNYQTVKFKGDPSLIGNFINVEITETLPWGLKGKKS